MVLTGRLVLKAELIDDVVIVIEATVLHRVVGNQTRHVGSVHLVIAVGDDRGAVAGDVPQANLIHVAGEAEGLDRGSRWRWPLEYRADVEDISRGLGEGLLGDGLDGSSIDIGHSAHTTVDVEGEVVPVAVAVVGIGEDNGQAVGVER